MKFIFGCFLITLFPILLSGCKGKKFDFFTYDIVDNDKICAVKPNAINKADAVSKCVDHL